MRSMLVWLGTLSCCLSMEWKPLWEGEAPGAKPLPAGTETEKEGLRFGRVEQPQYAFYPAPKDKATGQGMVVLPGGGYSIVSVQNEGDDYAKWLNERGISAMVVKYRVSVKTEDGYGFPVPFLDARRAIRMMRAKAEEWGVDPEQVGVMGSSAGGHLASLCVTRFADEFAVEGRDEIDRQDCRPDFGILVYPVIAMAKEFGHTGSKKRLIGEDADEQTSIRMSTEMQVGPETPPCFLLTTADDRVDCRNSLFFAAACREHGVPVALHLFEKGGHGYGIKGKGNVAVWPDLLEAWLEKR